jgi:hypothetical protein
LALTTGGPHAVRPNGSIEDGQCSNGVVGEFGSTVATEAIQLLTAAREDDPVVRGERLPAKVDVDLEQIVSVTDPAETADLPGAVALTVGHSGAR